MLEFLYNSQKVAPTRLYDCLVPTLRATQKPKAKKKIEMPDG